MREKLTAAKVEALFRKSKSSMSSDGGGLYFRNRKNSASWVIRRTRHKKSTYTTVAHYPEVSLAGARELLRRFESESIEDKTVADLLQDWYEQNEPFWRRPEQMEGYIRRLTSDDPRLVASNIHRVDLVTVRNSLKNYARNHGNVGANRLMEVLKQVFRHAVQIGYMRYSPISELTRKVIGGVESPRDRVLTDEEIRLLWNCETHSALFRFLLLTGQRIRETQIATWTDIDDGRWFIPASNNKSARDHWVALSRQATEVLDSQRPGNRRIFGSVSPTAVQAYLRRWCERNRIGENNRESRHQGHFTPHDLRRTFATRLNDMQVGPHIVEKILNHSMSGVMAIYNHADYENERVAAMQLWADELERINTERIS